MARFELAICRIDERSSNQSFSVKGGGVALRLEKETVDRFGCDEICIASVESVVSEETLGTKSLIAHFRERQGSECATFDLTNSSGKCSRVAERVSRCEVGLERSNRPKITLIPAGKLDVRYCGNTRVLHSMGFPNSLQRYRALPVAFHRNANNDAAEQASSSSASLGRFLPGFLRLDETGETKTLLCYVMVDPGNQPCPSVVWRCYELFYDVEQGFYLQKQGDRASSRMVQRTDFVGDEAPRGAVILNHEDQFVGLLAFLKNGRLHPVFFHNCDFVTSSQGWCALTFNCDGPPQHSAVAIKKTK